MSAEREDDNEIIDEAAERLAFLESAGMTPEEWLAGRRSRDLLQDTFDAHVLDQQARMLVGDALEDPWEG